MKKKFLVLAAVVTVLAAMTACGSKDTAKDVATDTKKESVTDTTKDNTNVKDPTVNNSEKNNSETNTTVSPEANPSNPTEDEKEVITAVKEEEIVVDFDGVKLPLAITWDDFKKFMTENNWTFVDKEKNFPSDKKFYGSGIILTNCGEVEFYFTENETNTEAVLGSIYISSDISGTKISIHGINCKTTEEKLSKVLTAKPNTESTFYLDDFVEIRLSEIEIEDTDGMVDLAIERIPFHMR